MSEPRVPERDWFDLVPKIELHLHLEGAIPHAALWTLVQKYGGDPTLGSVSDLAARFQYRDFSHFIETWVWKNGFLREVEDFEFIAREVARDLAAQKVRYVEAFFSPGDFLGHGLEPGRLSAAIRRGLDQVPAVEVALVADLIRDFGPARGARMLDAVHEAREHGIIGVGIGGSEDAFPPEAFGDVFRRARDLGFRTSAHAGEAAGPESVWGALRILEVDRIGHATRAREDPALMEHLARHQIPVELCLVSNLRTGVIGDLSEHPLRRYRELGIPLSINTDDPKMFDTSLAAEYRALNLHLGFSREEIRAMILDSVQCAWLPRDRREDLMKSMRDEFPSSEP